MDAQFEKILKLVKKIGEKIVVIKDDSEFVITGLDEYMRLIGDQGQIGQLTESQMLDKINRDIALWREAQKESLTEQTAVEQIESIQVPTYELESEIVRYAPVDHRVQTEIDQLNEQIQAVYKEHLASQNNIDLDYVSQSFTVDNQPQELKKEIKRVKQGVSYEIPSSSNLVQPLPSVEQTIQPVKHKPASQSGEKSKPVANFQTKSSSHSKILKTKTEKTKPEAKSPRINNFGYPNPEDTPFNEEQLNQQPSLDRHQQENIPHPIEAENG